MRELVNFAEVSSTSGEEEDTSSGRKFQPYANERNREERRGRKRRRDFTENLRRVLMKRGRVVIRINYVRPC